jgi:uncharacterized protein (DUF433 family)
MTIPKELKEVLVSTQDTLGGSVRFRETRVPVRALLDALTCGRSIEYFLEGYPGVSREQAEAVLRWEQNQARKTFGVELAS